MPASAPRGASYRVARLLVAIGSLALAAAPSAHAVPLPPSQAPLPGSSFQGADGNQDDAPPDIDWQALRAAGRVEHTSDPNAEDSAFAGGSKEYEPDDWDFSVEKDGVNPAKANIRDAWSSVDEPPGRSFLYLAFAREEEGGTAFLTFELNRDSRLWTNSEGARVPCRRTGDLLIAYEPRGNDVSVVVRRWVTARWDAGSGCAESGRLDDVSGVTANVDAQGAINRTAIAARLPGAYRGEVPAERFGEAAIDVQAIAQAASGSRCAAFTSMWMHSRSSDSENAQMQDYVAPQQIDARTCSAGGVKFLDVDADGTRDPAEPGIPGFMIFADYDGDGARDPGEPFAVTDEDGSYVVDDIRPPDGTYTLRERPVQRVASEGTWNCSFPNDDTPDGFGGPGPLTCGWGPISTAADPYARDKDFGNWLPARLTVRKELDPPDDPGRFDLSIDGAVVLPGAGDAQEATREVRPGTHTVAEVPVPPALATDYDSAVHCAAGALRGGRTLGAVSQDVTLTSGARVVCTFNNTRKGAPGIAIDKSGPVLARRGATLSYLIDVTNTGQIPFAASDIRVADPRCDAPPVLEDKRDAAGAPDQSGDTLDPGDVWTYTCERTTQPPGDPCRPGLARNTATVTASAAGATVGDRDSIVTLLVCPRRAPDIQVQKDGPASAPAGSTLSYLLYVRNAGEVAVRQRAVVVTDDACDEPPQIVSKQDSLGNPDATPRRFNPGDLWVYGCSRTTPAPGPGCEPSTVTNTVVAQVTVRGLTADASDTFDTLLTCPPGPPDPPVPPAPAQPAGGESAVSPAVAPPAAGVAGSSSLSPLQGCLRRGSRVTIRGERIASIRVFVGGERVRGLSVRPLQDRATVRLTRSFPPGRYRATAVIRFQPGASTPSVRLTRQVRVCASRAPRFTG